MRGRFVISFLFIVALASGCGFNPHPIDGTLSCNDGCPAGYVCRTAENRCWRASTPIADGGSDGAVVPKDGTAPDIGARDGLTAEAGRDVSADSSNPSDAAGKKDGGAEDGGEGADTVGSSDDAPVSADGTAGNGDTGGAGGGAGGGSDGSAITDGSGDAERGAAGAGGSGMTSGGTSGGGGSVTTSGGVTGGNNSGGSVTASGGITGGSHASGGVGGTGGGVGGSGGAGSGGSGGASSSGVCVPTIDKQCVDSTHLKTCGADGQWPATGTPCPYVCIDNPGNTDACGGVCVPTTDKQCADSTHLKTCGADGQWPATGTLCPFVCIDNPGNTDACGGVCVPTTDKQCADSTHLKTCGTDGQWPATGDLCPFVCIDNPGSTDACGGACIPGSKQCASGGTASQTCGADGQLGSATACQITTPSCAGGHCAYKLPNVGQLAETDTQYGGYIYAMQITPAATTKALRVGFYGAGTTGNIRFAIYDESGGLPNNLLASTTIAANANANVEVALGATVTLALATNYWIVALSDSNVSMHALTTSGPGYRFNNYAGYPAMPAAFPKTAAATATSYTLDFYLVVQDQ
jgi:hypothetical protein